MPNEAPHTIIIKWHINQFPFISELKFMYTIDKKINSIISSIISKKDKKWERLIDIFNITIKKVINKSTAYFL